MTVRVRRVTGSAYDLRAAEHAATLSALEQPVAAHAAVVLARARGVVELDAQEDLRVRHARHALERPAVPHDAAVVPARARQVDAVAHLQLLHNGRCSNTQLMAFVHKKCDESKSFRT